MKTTNLQAAQKDDRQVVPTGRDVLLRVHILIIWIICFFISAQAQTQQAWVAHYNNGILNGTNQAVKMAMDTAGNIYVTGFSQNANTNLGYVTIKYAPNGTQLWASRYDSTNYPTATPSGLVIDNSNNVIVTGNSVTVKYDPNGNQLWTAPYAGAALAVDSNAYVYVTGFGTQFNTVKLTPTGSNVWQTTYVDNVGPTLSLAILVDSNSNIYVTGSDNYEDGGEGTNIYIHYLRLDTIKYNTNGTQIWLVTDDNFYDETFESLSIQGMVVDGAGNLYIEANAPGAVGYDIYKYDASNGDLVWNITPSRFGSFCAATGMALDSDTNLLLSGLYPYAETFTGYNYYYNTYKVNSAGSTIWGAF